MQTKALRYLCLAGPTAAGKTAAAFALAAELPIEIISVDSALVYRAMNIGTAKPSAHELAQVPHHLIDILEPTQSYNAAQFVRDAQRLIGDITARGKLPLLVGGTMLYFKVLFDGLDAMPGADEEIRGALELEAKALGWPAMHAQLRRVDPDTADRLKPTDAQRIGRALEVYQIAGQPLSSFHTIKSRADEVGPSRDYALISLEPAERSWLHERIAGRFDAMLDAGFLDEVRALRKRGDLTPDLPAMRCVGYRQAWAYLDCPSENPVGEAQAFAQFRNQGIAATRQLAKRQITWLRSMPGRHVVACDAPDATVQVLALAKSLAQPSIKELV